MNTESVKSNWSDIKGKIKARFGKLTDENIESVKGNLDALSLKLQNTYGYAKEQADKELKGFKATLHSTNEAIKSPLVEEVKPAITEEAKLSTVTPLPTPSQKVA